MPTKTRRLLPNAANAPLHQGSFLPGFRKIRTSNNLLTWAADVAIPKKNKLPTTIEIVSSRLSCDEDLDIISRDASSITHETVPCWEDSDDDDDSCVCVVSRDGGADSTSSCVGIAADHTEAEEDDDDEGGSCCDDDSDDDASSAGLSLVSDFSKLSIGVHFADDMGLPLRSIHRFDETLPPGDDPLLAAGSNTSNACCSNRWDDPPCEPSHRWVRN